MNVEQLHDSLYCVANQLYKSALFLASCTNCSRDSRNAVAAAAVVYTAVSTLSSLPVGFTAWSVAGVPREVVEFLLEFAEDECGGSAVRELVRMYTDDFESIHGVTVDFSEAVVGLTAFKFREPVKLAVEPEEIVWEDALLLVTDDDTRQKLSRTLETGEYAVVVKSTDKIIDGGEAFKRVKVGELLPGLELHVSERVAREVWRL